MSVNPDQHTIQLLHMVAEGDLEVQELAAVLGCSKSTVYQMVQKYAGAVKKAAKDAKEAIMDIAVQEYQDTDVPVQDILEKYSISPPALYAALRARSIPKRSGDRVERNKNIIEMYKDPSNTIFDIEVACNTSVATIYKVLRQHGVPLRRGKSALDLEEITLPELP